MTSLCIKFKIVEKEVSLVPSPICNYYAGRTRARQMAPRDDTTAATQGRGAEGAQERNTIRLKASLLID